MRITRITRLRDFGIFRDFKWTDDLPDFGRYNLIYGWNGSGKTLLSNLLRRLEPKPAVTEGTATVRIDHRDVSAQDFDQEAVPIRVFNRKFIAGTVFKIGGPKPIYGIGRDSAEKQKQLAALRVSLQQTQTSVQAQRDKYNKAEDELDKFCIGRAKQIKEDLGGGRDNLYYSNYDKSKFAAKAHELSEQTDVEQHKLDHTERSRLLAQQRAVFRVKVDEIVYTFPDLSTLFREVAALLARTVISSTLNELADDPELAEWVHEGLALHRDRESQTCLFCTNPVTEKRFGKLGAHFDEEYECFLEGIDNMLAIIAVHSDAADEFFAPNKAELYDDISSDYDNALTRCHAERKRVIAALDLLDRNLQAKKAALFVSQSLPSQAPQVDNTVLDATNAYIRKHNKACDDFEKTRTDARQRLETGYVVDALDEYTNFVNAEAAAKSLLEKTRQTVEETEKEIDLIERDIVSHRQPADELNRDLREYLGHDELSLQVEETGYQITRNGQIANELSEGERTAIALLYFLKSLTDESFDLMHGIVVLDDPVSSLDANALFCAFGFIRECTEDAAQLFVLTHNFAFFRQVRNWFHHLKGQGKKNIADRPAHFYMLDCIRDGNNRCARIRRLDRLLEEYESEYHYLFSIVYREAHASPPDELESCYYLPNVARRLLEAFLAFRRPQTKGIWKQLQEIDFDENRKTGILRFLDTHSHRDAQFAGPEHDLSILAETPSVLRDLMELMKEEDKHHYWAMVSLVKETSNTETAQGTP